VCGTPLKQPYRATCDALFEPYRTTHRALTERFPDRSADRRPPEIGDDEHRRTVRARTFFVARYLLREVRSSTV
jgi:hypothetical protein